MEVLAWLMTAGMCLTAALMMSEVVENLKGDKAMLVGIGSFILLFIAIGFFHASWDQVIRQEEIQRDTDRYESSMARHQKEQVEKIGEAREESCPKEGTLGWYAKKQAEERAKLKLVEQNIHAGGGVVETCNIYSDGSQECTSKNL